MSRRAFSLLELLMTLTCAALVLVPLSSLTSTGARVSAARLAQLNRQGLAEAVLARLLACRLQALRALPAVPAEPLPAGWQQFLLDEAAVPGTATGELRVGFELDVAKRPGLHRITIVMEDPPGGATPGRCVHVRLVRKEA